MIITNVHGPLQMNENDCGGGRIDGICVCIRQAGGQLVDQRFCPRIVEGELRYNLAPLASVWHAVWALLHVGLAYPLEAAQVPWGGLEVKPMENHKF